MRWKTIIEMVSKMFSHDRYSINREESVTTSKVHFYGNDGVCLFKYFVTKDDPQKYFVWTIVTVNFICFVFITVSYVLIGLLSGKSSKCLTNSHGNNQLAQRNQKINRKIAIIIATDFCCWVPFIVICFLHFLEVVDATPWYSMLSMIILPINSAINPLLYDDIVTANINALFDFISVRIYNLVVNQRLITYFSFTTQIETIEMEQIETRRRETAG